jgi:tRNA(Ile2) C34 agmatinyltransferase TiaS
MENLTLHELDMHSRNEVITFLKKLWNGESAPCPICGNALELLHKKAKKSDCDWQCKKCEKIIRTLDILNELNHK